MPIHLFIKRTFNRWTLLCLAVMVAIPVFLFIYGWMTMDGSSYGAALGAHFTGVPPEPAEPDRASTDKIVLATCVMLFIASFVGVFCSAIMSHFLRKT